MTTPPRANLRTESMPWGRSIERGLSALRRGASRLDRDSSNASSALNSRADTLSGQIEAIAGIGNVSKVIVPDFSDTAESPVAHGLYFVSSPDITIYPTPGSSGYILYQMTAAVADVPLGSEGWWWDPTYGITNLTESLSGFAGDLRTLPYTTNTDVPIEGVGSVRIGGRVNFSNADESGVSVSFWIEDTFETITSPAVIEFTGCSLTIVERVIQNESTTE